MMKKLRTVLSYAFVFWMFFAGTAFAQQAPQRSLGFFDIILVVLAIYLVFRIMRRRGGRGDYRDSDERRDYPEREDQPEAPDRFDAARAMWDMLGAEDTSSRQVTRKGRSSGFDEAEFLEGAKMFYARMHEAMNDGKWDMVASFIDPALLEDLKRRQQGNVGLARTDILLLDARVIDVETSSGQTLVSVSFDAQLRKGVSGEEQVTEKVVWEFSRPENDPDALWTLESMNSATH